VQGLSLAGGAMASQLRRNPAPLIAGLMAILVFRGRRRRRRRR
jgi:hypothetical protein